MYIFYFLALLEIAHWQLLSQIVVLCIFIYILECGNVFC